MRVIQRPVLRYHGGKFLLAPWIISLLPAHDIYVEPFGGAGSILMRKPRAYAEVYNDKWDTVVNVFRVLRDPVLAAQLQEQLELTPFARTEFMGASEAFYGSITDPVEKARLTILRSFAGFGSAASDSSYNTGFRANSNRSGSTPAHDWVNYPSYIKGFTARLMGVIIENRDYAQVIASHDTPKTLFYLDPPYMHETRNSSSHAYSYEMDDQQHTTLAAHLHSITGMAMISGYDSGLYSELYKDWQVFRKTALGDGAAKRIECIWINDAGVRNMKKELFAQ